MDSLCKTISSRERGAALIIVLAFVVLLTGLVLAYFSRATSDRSVAQSSFNQSKVDLIAASGMDLVIGGLRQEITGTSPTPTPPYFPSPNANMLPLRFGTSDLIPNLVRRSVQDDGPTGANPIPSPGIASLASAVSSTAASVNNRSITLSRWNKHYLILRPAGANPTDTTPDPTVGFTPPDWVILTRNGPVAFPGWDAALKDPTQSNSSYCVGRYAYAIYDEGGLLDANVAGFPSSTSAAQYGPKGVSAFADLTVLGLSQNDIDAIVGWRNYLSAQTPNGNLGSFPFNFNATTATNYVASVLSNTNGFVSVPVPSPTPKNMSRTDQRFPTRQSLIRLLVSSGLSANAANALQYLGSFLRETNSPSFTPARPTGINPNFPSTLVTTSFPRFDGTAAVVGEPLVKRRFPLSRLGWITYKGPSATLQIGKDLDPSLNTPATSDPILIQLVANNVSLQTIRAGTAANILTCFGLAWDNINQRWNYVGHGGSAAPISSIATLGSLTDTREPDFFELLKAAILNASIGIGSGPGNTFVAAEVKYYDVVNGPSADYQIMQIGANIIDQADPDNVPTFVGFGLDPLTSQPYELAGAENLPYLNKLVFKPYWRSANQFDAWLIPSLWNPHQNAPTAATAPNVRIAMTAGTMAASVVPTTGSTLTSSSITGDPTTPPSITVDSSKFTTFPSGVTTAALVGTSGAVSASTDPNPGPYYGFHFTFGTSSFTPTQTSAAYPTLSGCSFELQVQVGTAWKAYQRWTGCGPSNPPSCQSPPDWTVNTLQDPEFVALDPRTVRFGIWGNAAVQSGTAADYTNGTQYTLDSTLNSPSLPVELITAQPPQGTTFGLSTSPYQLHLYANNADSTVHYTDLDGLQRRGDVPTAGTPTDPGDDELQPTLGTDRPLILNRPFRDAGELGEVFRDQPWKTLNFTTADSADAALLDVFGLHESDVEAGKTSLNTKQKPVLTAILSHATKQISGTSDINASTGPGPIVDALYSLTQAQPMANKAELVTRLAADPSVTGLGNKEARECVVRAFSDAGETRTWNLLIDVVAQSGRYPPNASTLAGFFVEGEQHYWVHVAIDRFTGQVIDKQIEVVNE